MRKLIVTVIALLMAFGGAGTALAGHEGNRGPGPNGHNNHGLCTAYFNGQKQGHDKHDKDSPPPFAELERRAEEEADENNDDDEENDVSGADAVLSWCQDSDNNPKGVGGQPSKGRHGDKF